MKLLVFSALPLYLFGGFYRWLLVAGLLAQGVYLLLRGLKMGRLPLVGVHDTLVFMTASIVLFALPLWARLKEEGLLRWAAAVLLSVLSLLALLAEPRSGPLPPVLRTYWFELHVALSFFSYALFALAALLGLQFLLQGEAGAEKAQYRMALMGYLLFSLSMVAGGVWAFLAWGTYWLWTPKELWSSILWLYWSLYLHARLRLSPRASAALGTGGFAVAMFTYLGVGLLMKSSHTF